MFGQRVLTLPPYAANLEHRTATAPPSLHEANAELFYVVEGAATLVTGLARAVTGVRGDWRDTAADPDGLGVLTLFYSRDGGGFIGVPMIPADEGAFKAVIPGFSAASVVRFYVSATDGAAPEAAGSATRWRLHA
mgnify:CR=1 FL=1